VAAGGIGPGWARGVQDRYGAVLPRGAFGMKILFHHRVASRDGQAVHMEELLAALTAQGHETVLVGPPGLTQTSFGGSSRLVDRIRRIMPAAAFELLEVAYNVKAFLRLHTAVRRHKPDIIYERFSLFLFAGVWVRRLFGLPVLLEVNSPLYEERAANDGLKLHFLGRWAQRRVWNNVDWVLPVTHVLARTVAEYGVPAARIAVIPNGVNTGRFGNPPNTEAARRALGLKPGMVLGFAGFIRDWNALHRVVDFIAEQGARYDLQFLVVGDGPARAALLRHAETRGVADRVTVTGIVGRDDVARCVSAFDIALLPGLTPYSSPLKLFEYMYLRRAIVAPDTENIREILTDGHDAVLFDPRRPGGMEEALLRLCGDAGLRARIGIEAHRTIDEKSLTWSGNAERVVELAEAALRGGPAKCPARVSGHGRPYSIRRCRYR
jgi:glycosyltransferase involved in cell wall biosynthesis